MFIDVDLPEDAQNADAVLTHTEENVGTNGQVADLLDAEEQNILGEGTITADTFEEDTDGATNSTPVDVSLRINSDHTDIEESADPADTDTVTVDVTNASGEVNGDGTFSTALESSEDTTE